LVARAVTRRGEDAAVDLFAGARLAAVFFAAGRLAVVRFAGAFLAAVFRAGARLAVEVRLAGDFFAADFLAVARLTVDLVALAVERAFVAADALFVVVFLAAVVVLFRVERRARAGRDAAFLTGVMFVTSSVQRFLVALAGDFFAGAVFFARPVFLAGAAFLAAAAFFAPPLELSEDLKAAAGLKRTPLDAAIFTGAPVCGFRPMRAALDVGVKVPNPKIDTLLPDLASAITESTKAETAASACFFSRPAAPATLSMSSVRFTATLLCRWGSCLS
jgi:hypothetical protein